MKNLQARAVTESDLCLRKTALATFWKVVFKDGKSGGEGTSEREVVQVRNNKGLRKVWI